MRRQRCRRPPHTARPDYVVVVVAAVVAITFRLWVVEGLGPVGGTSVPGRRFPKLKPLFKTFVWGRQVKKKTDRRQQEGRESKVEETKPPTKEVLLSKKLAAISSMRSCYRSVLLSASVDLLTDAWVMRKATAPYRILEALNVCWKLGFARGLFRMSGTMIDRGVDVVPDSAWVDQYYRTMRHVWRQTAELVSLASAVDLASRFRRRIPLVPLAFSVFLPAVALLAGYASKQETDSLAPRQQPPRWRRRRTRRRNDRLRGGIADDDLSVHDKVEIIARNMAWSSAAVIGRAAFVVPVLALAKPSRTSKILGFASVSSPLFIGLSLLNLRHSGLEVYRSVVDGDWTTSVQARMFDSQRKFYSKVSDSLRNEAAFKVLVVAVAAAKSKRAL